MRDRFALVLIFLLPAAAGPAWADGVVLRASGCGDTIFVTAGSGVSVLRGDSVGIKEGDTLQGNVDRIGQPLLFDTTAGRSVFARVAELNLTDSEAKQRIAVSCRAPLAEAVVSGYVTRTSGCGSKIYVNTAGGYAELQRIAGGIVAEGDTLRGNLNRPGRITVRDEQSDSTLTVFVEDLWMSKSATDRKIRQSCRSQGR